MLDSYFGEYIVQDLRRTNIKADVSVKWITEEIERGPDPLYITQNSYEKAIIKFKNKEDKHLYKLIGEYQESKFIEYKVK